MTIALSDRINAIQPSATIAVNTKAQALIREGVPVINLSVGEPDFDTPAFISEAAIKAIHDGKTRYTAADGMIELKQAIGHKLKRDNQLTYEPQDIVVTSGAKQAIFNAMQAILQSGDEVIIPAPYWVSYPDMVILTGATPVIASAGIEQHYKITPEQLSLAITSRTKMLILNSPSNPTGACYTHEELQALSEVLLEHPNITILTDDIYEYIRYGKLAFSNIINACPKLDERTIIVNGVSKAHAMTGWRIGYAAGRSPLIPAIKKLQSQSTSCANSVAQHAATAALLADPSEFFPPMLSAYQERHDYLLNAINQIRGFKAIASSGSFYLFVDASAAIANLNLSDDIALASYLLEQAHVATVPGTAFGSPRYLRLSFATDMESLKQAVTSLTKTLA